MIRKIIKALWILLAVVVLAIVVIFVSISKGWIGYMPPVEELENPNYKFATEIFSEDGTQPTSLIIISVLLNTLRLNMPNS